MAHDSDQQVLNSATGLGCSALIIGLVVIPPLFLPAFVIYRLAVVTGATTLHPAILIPIAAASIWGIVRLGGMLIRSAPPRGAQLVIAAYIGACYTFVLFQRQLTTARSELDLPWLILAFAIFTFVGWKVGASLVLKVHRNELARLQKRQAQADI